MVATALSFLVSATRAQTGSLKDLGSLLAGQKNLSTFYSLIQVCYQKFLFVAARSTSGDALRLWAGAGRWGKRNYLRKTTD